jgi:hypothetical protein
MSCARQGLSQSVSQSVSQLTAQSTGQHARKYKPPIPTWGQIEHQLVGRSTNCALTHARIWGHIPCAIARCPCSCRRFVPSPRSMPPTAACQAAASTGNGRAVPHAAPLHVQPLLRGRVTAAGVVVGLGGREGVERVCGLECRERGGEELPIWRDCNIQSCVNAPAQSCL